MCGQTKTTHHKVSHAKEDVLTSEVLRISGCEKLKIRRRTFIFIQKRVLVHVRERSLIMKSPSCPTSSPVLFPSFQTPASSCSSFLIFHITRAFLCSFSWEHLSIFFQRLETIQVLELEHGVRRDVPGTKFKWHDGTLTHLAICFLLPLLGAVTSLVLVEDLNDVLWCQDVMSSWVDLH